MPSLTDEQIDHLWATEDPTIPCPACKGTAQDEDGPDCATCENYGCFDNPRHPGNWPS